MKNILIIGYGVTGQSFRRFFSDSEIRIFIYDDKKKDISVSDNFNYSKIDLALLSPGINKDHEIIKKIKEFKIRLISDLDLFCELKSKKAKIIGVTGTNGKSTTSALLHFVLEKNGKKAVVCGNNGIPLMDVVDKNYDFFVIELSSYQLSANSKYKLDYGVLLNITNDHLEYHKTFENYKNEKMKILTNSERAALIQMTDATKSIEGKLFKFVDLVVEKNFVDNNKTSLGNLKNYYWDDKKLKLYGEDEDCVVFDGSGLVNLSFMTNRENIASVFAAASYLGIDNGDIADAVTLFKGLPHRQEVVFQGNIKIINDSKATNLDATLKAIDNFDANIHLILGGISKNDDFKRLNAYQSKIKKIYTYGQDGLLIAESFKDIPVDIFDTLEEAVKGIAFDDNDVILFAPACASFDQFENFEDRGDIFKEFVNKYLMKMI